MSEGSGMSIVEIRRRSLTHLPASPGLGTQSVAGGYAVSVGNDQAVAIETCAGMRWSLYQFRLHASVQRKWCIACKQVGTYAGGHMCMHAGGGRWVAS